MRGRSGAELEALRKRLTDDQRAILNAIWEHYRDQNQWVLRRVVHQRFGKPAACARIESLGNSIVGEDRDDGRETYRLTFLGVLLTDQGEESEELLVRYLEYIRDRVKSDPRMEWVGSQEVEAALGLTADRSRLLRQLIRLSHWWGGGSGFGDREWTVGVPIDVDDLLSEPDLRTHVREHVLRHFLPGAFLGEPKVLQSRPHPSREESPRGVFWFVRDPAIGQRLAMDWREAQDVYHVRGWKSCVILCGGILEGMLRDALNPGKPQARHLPAREKHPTSTALGRSTLAALVEAAMARGILGHGTLHLGRALREFRTLIHPGRQTHRKLEVTRDEAERALDAVRNCLRQIAAREGIKREQL